MRNSIICVLALLRFVCNAKAQDHEPTTTWPYVYADFSSGELQPFKGSAVSGTYNVHILYGRLHFIDGQNIREANPLEVFSVKIGSDFYANVGGKMMKVLAKGENAFVAMSQEVDMVQLNATGGAYGSSSSTLATTALSSLEAIGNGVSATNHMELKRSKNDGKILPIISKTYIVFNGLQVFAAKKDVMALDGIDKKELSAFLKENKIKWKDPQSLLVLGEYLNEKLKK